MLVTWDEAAVETQTGIKIAPNPLDPYDVLEMAANEMEKRGWARGTNEDIDGRVCLDGAIRAATWGTGHYAFNDRDALAACYQAAAGLVQRYLYPTTDDEDCECDSYIDWNDHNCHSGEEAVTVLRSAAKLRAV